MPFQNDFLRRGYEIPSVVLSSVRRILAGGNVLGPSRGSLTSPVGAYTRKPTRRVSAASVSGRSTPNFQGSKVMAKELTIEAGQLVLYKNTEYTVASASRDDIRLTEGEWGGKYVDMSVSEFMSDYTYVTWGWVPKAVYRVNQQNGDTRIMQSFNIVVNDIPTWYYIVQHRDETPRLVSEREMRTEVKDDVKNTWVRIGKEIVYVTDFKPDKVLKVTPTLSRNPNIMSLSADTAVASTKQPRYSLYETIERGPYRDKTVEGIQPVGDSFRYIFSDYTSADEENLK